ncbi:uncharacterized protein LOC100175068 [Ciona intestinalis]
MESVFCFEVAVDCLNLRNRVKCFVPYIAVAFLDFPTILLYAERPTKRLHGNVYKFTKGKSCLFKMSPTEVYEKLTKTPVYVVVLDKGGDEQKCIGSTSIELKDTIKRIVGDLQTNGLHQATCYGENLTIPILNYAHACVGALKVAYKLTSLGHSMLPHLAFVPPSSTVHESASSIAVKNVDVMPFSTVENVITPPPLYYKAEPSDRKASGDVTENPKTKDASTAMPVSTKTREGEKNDHITLKQEPPKPTLHNTQGKLISIQTNEDRNTEATQTDIIALKQYPILSALVKEVLQLSIGKETELNVRKVSEDKGMKQDLQQPCLLKPRSGATHKDRQTTSAKATKSNKKYPLQYGLTKSLRLRMALTAAEEDRFISSAPKPKKHVPLKKKPAPGRLKKKSGIKQKREMGIIDREITPEPEIAEVINDDPSYLKDADSSGQEDQMKKTRNIGLGLEDLVIVREISSPRAQSRQSIEIRLPTAQDEKENSTGNYTYSDDFDDEKSWSYERTTSVLTTFEMSPQPTVLDAVSEAEQTTNEVTNHLTVDVSPQHTISDVSPSATFATTPREMTMDDLRRDVTSPQFATFTVNQYKTKHASEESQEESFETSKHPSPRQESSAVENDSKPTDDSASVATTLFAHDLPVPAPSSVSPVIRSLASEPRIKPYPPSRSQSLSHEKLHRKFRMSTESSFQMSEPSDIRTSDLADIRTSDIISELNTSTENNSPNASDILGRKVSFPKL